MINFPTSDQLTHLMLGNRRACSDEYPHGIGWNWAKRDLITCGHCLLLCSVAEANGIEIPHRWAGAGKSPGWLLREDVARVLSKP